jgi:hypothetical protein
MKNVRHTRTLVPVLFKETAKHINPIKEYTLGEGSLIFEPSSVRPSSKNRAVGALLF